MISFAMDGNRLSRARFALSRLAELTNSLEVLAHPGRAPYAAGWVATTRPRLDPAVVGVLFPLVEHASWYVPDFVAPVPAEYEPSLADELAAVAATPTELVRHQLRMAFRIGPPPPEVSRAGRTGAGGDPRAPLPPEVAAVLAAGEPALAERVADDLERAWRIVLADWWPALRRVLDADVRHRATEASRHGFGRFVDDLHPELDWDGTRLALRRPYDLTVPADRDLVLLPSAFLPRPAAWLGNPDGIMVGYPARGRGQVWVDPGGAGPAAGVLGPRRAALLADLRTARSTTELADRHRLSPATVSYHLSRLRAAGLVTPQRAGHSVLYECSVRGAALLAAVGPNSAQTR